MPYKISRTLCLLAYILVFACTKNDSLNNKSNIYVALPTPPVKVLNTSGNWLVYDLHITTNVVEKVDVYNNSTQLLSYTNFNSQNNLHIANIWLAYPQNGWEQESLVHKFQYKDANNKQQVHTFNLPIELDYPNPKTIQFPVPEGVWLAEGAPGSTSYHTRAIFPYQEPKFDPVQNGYLIGNNPQRYAIDYAKLENNLPYINNGQNLSDWHCYNLPILAAEGGEVLFTESSIPDNTTPGELDYPTDTTNANGNVVFIKHADGSIGVYCHMIPNSILVNVGDIVSTGDILGRLGNSGNSFAPHLHMHILTNPENKPLLTYQDGFYMESLPYKFSQFTKLGQLNPDHLDQTPIIPFAPSMNQLYHESLPSESDVIEF